MENFNYSQTDLRTERMMGNDYRIFTICVAKNEEDIIEYSLKSATKWADRIFFMDNGSTDSTWEIVQNLNSDKIVAWKINDKPFHDGIRAEVFNEFRHEAREGDWWLFRHDADEFPAIPVRSFLSMVPRHNHVVFGINVNYYLVPDDLGSIDFSAPIEDVLPRIRHYLAKDSEPRFFRHRDRLQWRIGASWPDRMGVPYRKHMLFKHYRYRSPAQIRTRLQTRKQALEAGFEGWWSSAPTDWREIIKDSEELSFDDGSGVFRIGDIENHYDTDGCFKRCVRYWLHRLKIWP